LGQTALLGYEDLAVPDIGSQSIRLWQDEKYLGLVPVKEVLQDHLRPGYMLWLRGDPPPRSKRQPPPGGYDYEVQPLGTQRPDNIKQSKFKGFRAREFYLSASSPPGHVRVQLLSAYRYLDRKLRVTTPVEFHLKATRQLSHADLSLFTKDRVDLHPAVILRAMPEGVFQALEPKGDIEEGDALWIVATNDLEASPYSMPGGPFAKAAKVRKMVDIKMNQLKEALEAGRITPKGEMTKKWQHEMRRGVDLEGLLEENTGRDDRFPPRKGSSKRRHGGKLARRARPEGQ
jgi:hypothetical protein